MHLLLMRWKGPRERWGTSMAECWCIPVRPASGTQVSVRLAIYMFLREGIHAIHGQRGAQNRIVGSTRLSYDPNSGVPKLFDGRQLFDVDEHPQDFERELDAGRMLWFWTHESRPGHRLLEEHTFSHVD